MAPANTLFERGSIESQMMASVTLLGTLNNGSSR